MSETRHVAATDRWIDTLVYEAHGLTEDEIRVVQKKSSNEETLIWEAFPDSIVHEVDLGMPASFLQFHNR